ncbi:mitochondria-eating protein isoform X2 [Rhinolophus sinicus]|uniref:mitochondria-eating protein isoform X2 n=1 Tax=Rhinolophus sinicus TaxID=89399 RepID=UPI003D7BB78F
MAENLRKLVSSESLRSMQDKLELWLRDYNTNSCDQNLSLCLELIEQVAKVQGQLFGILTATAQEGGHYDGVEVIKSRLLPWLEASFTAASLGKPVSSKAPSPQAMFAKEKQKESGVRDWNIKQLDSELNSTRNQLNQVQDELKSLQAQEEARNRNSERRGSLRRSSEQRGAESRGSEPRSPDLRSSEQRRSEWGTDKRGWDNRSSDKHSSDKWNAETICDYEKQIRTLKDEITALCAEKSALQGRSARSRSPSPAPRGRSPSRSHSRSQSRNHSRSPSRSHSRSQSRNHSRSPSRSHSRSQSRNHSRSRSHSHSRSQSRNQSPSRSRSHSRSQSRSQSPSRSRAGSPSAAVVKIRTPSPNRARLSSAARRAALLSRFSDAYSQARLDAQRLLRRCIDKTETLQRIIYIATVEAFHVAKMAFRHFKIRVRKSLTPSYAGTNDFEAAVLDYILCHLDLYDAQSSVNDVIRAMNINPKISFPPEVDFCILSNFIQEICSIAFEMQTLEPPLDIAFGADGEVFNDCKYRRSYDSDFTAPLVFYHVWPALMENDTVIMKGEAVTKRGAFWNSVQSVSRCRSRSLSPISLRNPIGLSTVSRSRSPSPIRCGLPRF